MPRVEIIVSVENNAYQVWQAMLFHFSCCKHQGQAPVIVVHKGEEPLLDGFARIVRAGGIVQQAPNYRHAGRIEYPPRNTPATLRFVESDAEYVMLCEPDMVFLQRLALEDLELSHTQVSFDRVSYLEPDRASYQPALDEVCRKAGIDPQELRRAPIPGGVPHIVPICLKEAFSEAWLSGIELFVEFSLKHSVQADSSIDWIASMWAVVLAVHRLRLGPLLTQFCLLNRERTCPLPPLAASGPKILHYCYVGEGFNKRDFFKGPAATHHVWNVPPDDGSIDGAIRGQLREAREFYHL